MTINELKKHVEAEIRKGNKTIMISNDDEGNGYHYVWYAFTPANDIPDLEYEIEPSIAKLEDTIILG